MKTITVEVTQADIDAGERMNCHRCPVALALRRYTKGGLRAGAEGIYGRNTQKLVAHFPTPVSTFILYFDICQPVHPFSFSLSLPEKYLKKSFAKGLTLC